MKEGSDELSSDLCDLPRLVVTSNQSDSAWKSDLLRERFQF